MKVRGVPPTKKVTFKTKMSNDVNVLSQWWLPNDPDKAAAQLLTSAAFLKENQGQRFKQAGVYARLYGNQSLYNFAGTSSSKLDSPNNSLNTDRPTFNLIQSATDTLVSRISQSRPQPRFLTDNSDYKQRNLAKKLNNFILGEFYHIKAYEIATQVLRDALVEGTGCVHFFEKDEKVAAERVLLTELLIDPNEGMYGEPRQLFRMKLVDRDVLLANFPKMKAKISQAARAYPDNSQDASKTVSDLVMVVEGWHLPSGKDAGDGRHMLTCSMGNLYDEEYTKSTFPFSFIHYSPRLLGFWSQGLAEQLMGTQIELNSILYTIARAIKLVGVPRVFQEEGSKISAAAHNNEIGVVVKYRGTKPSYEVAPSNAPELYAERDKLIQYGYQQCGVSALQASSQKPQGLDSGEAIRTYDDISTDRFASLSRRFDNLFIDFAYQIIDLASDIAKRTGKYSTVYPNKNGTKEIDLPKAAIETENPFIIQCFTQSSLPKDPAGRLAKVTEMMQAGIITMQEGRRMLDYPDLDQVETLANAAEERILQILDEIIETGKYTPPDPFMDLQLATQLTTQYINLYSQAKLEESKAQKLRDFFSQIQTIIQAATPPPMPQAPAAAPQAVPQAPPQSPLLPNSPQAS